MKMADLLNVIQELACSQGFYGRLYRDLMELKEDDEIAYSELVEEWESQNFTDSLDFILYLEQ